MNLLPTCPGGCGQPVPPGHFLCRVCWTTVSDRSRRRLITAYQAWCDGTGSEQAYLDATAWAVRSSRHGRRYLNRRRPELAARRAAEPAAAPCPTCGCACSPT